MENVSNIYLSKAELVMRPKWSQSLIFFLNLKQDKIIKNALGQDIKHYSMEKILDAEGSLPFAKYTSASPEEQKALFAEVKESYDKSRELAINSDIYVVYSKYITLEAYQENIGYASEENTLSDTIIVNFIRHRKTNYEKLLKILFTYHSYQDACKILKFRVLARIAAVYREFAEECATIAKPYVNWCDRHGFFVYWETGLVVRKVELQRESALSTVKEA